MMNRILNICIASYNKAALTYSLVQSILKNDNEKLGVVVVDNASTDSTVQLLKTIDDDRLTIIVNKSNIGGSANMVRAIYSAEGYCLYCNDRDKIYTERLNEFIEFLENNPNYSCGWVSRKKTTTNTLFTEYDVLSSFQSMCWRCEHPTGFFFNSRFLKAYDESSWNEFISPFGWTAFPFENIQAELVTESIFVRYNIPVWSSTGNDTHKKYVSEFEKLNTGGDRWFYTENCINRGKAYLNQFWSICDRKMIQVDEKTRFMIYANIILCEQKIGAWRYKTVFESDSLAYHYAVKPRKVSRKEVSANSNRIVNELISFVRDHENGVSRFETIINQRIQDSDKKTQKRLLISKIGNSAVARIIRGKH
jgi:glycosyltransferase involved in cell wall biosynthesis